MKTVSINKRECHVEKSYYPNGHAALKLILANSGEDYLLATVYMRTVDLRPNEVIVKDYSENKGIFEVLESAGVVRPTGRTIENGFVTMPVCELLPPYRELTLDERLNAHRGEVRHESPGRDAGIER